MKNPNKLWKDDTLQFTRLLAEIWAVGLDKGQIDNLCESMDLPRERLYELFERADAAFDKIKKEHA